MTEKSVYKLLQETRGEHAKLAENPIEAGDLTNECGKSYMNGLWKAIVDHRVMRLPIIWFIVIVKKDMKDDRIIRITIKAHRKPLKYLHEGVDLWEYDYLQDKLDLVWSLPHRTEMNNFIRNPDKYDKRLIGWIKDFIKQDKINLKDPSAVKL